MTERDDRLATALDLLTAQQRGGDPVQLETVLQKFPDLAEEIQSLWATAQLADQLGQFCSSSPPVDNEPPEAPAGPRKMVLGDYQLLEEIGRGGMGIVFRARQRHPERIVAVKMLLRGEFATSVHRARFEVEADAAARLDHPHIVAIYEAGIENGQPYFSMPFIEGTTLARRIAERTLSDREAAELLIPVCRAVGYAHQRGVLHRDLKPSNILIDRLGHPYVSDFGLAKRVETDPTDGGPLSLTESGAILGTPGYLAPEQAAGSRGIVSPATDVYSLGAILYACVTGRAPFQAANPVDALLMVLEQDPPPPRLLHPKIDIDLEMIILKALQKPVDLRYRTADALADDLSAYLRHEPVSARSSHLSQVISRAFRPTHHVGVLENWGLLWMWHAAVILVLCIITDVLRNHGVDSRWTYVVLWTIGLGAWGIIFWNLRHRAGPVTFVERQVAHLWAASMACSTSLYGVEWLLGLPVLTLSPVLALFAGSVFLAKAGILSGEFYLHSAALFATAIPMAIWPRVSVTIFGVVSALTFGLSGLKFHLLRRTNRRRGASPPQGNE
ncbi:serine/threonine-protein kinase [Planctomicrobium piriforme]|uniref:Serine/threonine protein kinase n=1 Tax=Planctomicrobium piriforme TaxID=1576369 RepID=A0A1I3KW72_9PLAN|nr:serine/threonine-protein kinase [Planctomicrobium piriforme]SFI76355.1 serine/threonine protein kinase [Planctomicrobium piriforme]